MTYEIVGVRRVDIEARDGQQEVHGWSVHTIHDEDGVEGKAAEKVFVRDTVCNDVEDCPGWVPSVGEKVRLNFNRRNKVDEVRLVPRKA